MNVLGLCTAGFVPQLFSPNFSPGVIQAMLGSSSASAFVIDPELASLADELDLDLPFAASLEIKALVANPEKLRIGDLPAVRPTDPAFIGHTSGSTAGLPKIIPQAHRWIAQIHAKWGVFEQPEYGSQTVLNTFGNLAHVGSFCGPC